MKIGIEKSDDGTFADRWVEYCVDNHIDYKIVDVYESDIVNQLKDCDAFMWHFSHGDYRDMIFARPLLYSLQKTGVKVFPDFNTCWHFDDKVGQKYLLEAVDAPVVPSYAFYTKADALKWIDSTSFPKVFKLRGGAGSSNVRLVRTKRQARLLTRKMFGRGFPVFDGYGNFKDRLHKFLHGKDTLLGVVKGFGRIFISTRYGKMHGRERGYVYFQDFIPNNDYDIRIITSGDKAFAIKRLVRDGDFRASGSGSLVYDKEQIDERCVKIAFDVNAKLETQSLALDFVFLNGVPLLVEISYGYSMHGYDKCPGYWDKALNWHEEAFKPQYWQIENLIDEIKK